VAGPLSTAHQVSPQRCRNRSRDGARP
jgi:hypothetical protein